MYGSITSKDLAGMSASAGAPAAGGAAPSQMAAGAAYYDVPVSGIRNVIAKRLLESKITIPHYYVTVDINMDQVS